MASSLLFSIPRLILPVRRLVQDLSEPLCEWPDGVGVVLVCKSYHEMELINDRVLNGRQPKAHLNLDMTSQPVTFSLYLDVADARGINLSSRDRVELMAMMSPEAQLQPWGNGDLLTRVVFGNDVDLSASQLQELVDGWNRHGRINVVVGCDVRGDMALYVQTSDTGAKAPQVLSYAQEYTTQPFRTFLAELVKDFRDNIVR